MKHGLPPWVVDIQRPWRSSWDASTSGFHMRRKARRTRMRLPAESCVLATAVRVVVAGAAMVRSGKVLVALLCFFLCQLPALRF